MICLFEMTSFRPLIVVERALTDSELSSADTPLTLVFSRTWRTATSLLRSSVKFSFSVAISDSDMEEAMSPLLTLSAKSASMLRSIRPSAILMREDCSPNSLPSSAASQMFCRVSSSSGSGSPSNVSSSSRPASSRPEERVEKVLIATCSVASPRMAARKKRLGSSLPVNVSVPPTATKAAFSGSSGKGKKKAPCLLLFALSSF